MAEPRCSRARRSCGASPRTSPRRSRPRRSSRSAARARGAAASFPGGAKLQLAPAPAGSSVIHSLLGGALSLLLVFRTNAAYDRWWEARKTGGRVLALRARSRAPRAPPARRACARTADRSARSPSCCACTPLRRPRAARSARGARGVAAARGDRRPTPRTTSSARAHRAAACRSRSGRRARQTEAPPARARGRRVPAHAAARTTRPRARAVERRALEEVVSGLAGCLALERDRQNAPVRDVRARARRRRRQTHAPPPPCAAPRAPPLGGRRGRPSVAARHPCIPAHPRGHGRDTAPHGRAGTIWLFTLPLVVPPPLALPPHPALRGVGAALDRGDRAHHRGAVQHAVRVDARRRSARHAQHGLRAPTRRVRDVVAVDARARPDISARRPARDANAGGRRAQFLALQGDRRRARGGWRANARSSTITSVQEARRRDRDRSPPRSGRTAVARVLGRMIDHRSTSGMLSLS